MVISVRKDVAKKPKGKVRVSHPCGRAIDRPNNAFESPGRTEPNMDFLALKPHNPRFYLQNVMVHKINVSDGLLASNMWFIVVSHKLNYNIGVI